jgi:hypothetical protein
MTALDWAAIIVVERGQELVESFSNRRSTPSAMSEDVLSRLTLQALRVKTSLPVDKYGR